MQAHIYITATLQLSQLLQLHYSYYSYITTIAATSQLHHSYHNHITVTRRHVHHLHTYISKLDTEWKTLGIGLSIKMTRSQLHTFLTVLLVLMKYNCYISIYHGNKLRAQTSLSKYQQCHNVVEIDYLILFHKQTISCWLPPFCLGNG